MKQPSERELQQMREEYKHKIERDEQISRLAIQSRMKRESSMSMPSKLTHDMQGLRTALYKAREHHADDLETICRIEARFTRWNRLHVLIRQTANARDLTLTEYDCRPQAEEETILLTSPDNNRSLLIVNQPRMIGFDLREAGTSISSATLSRDNSVYDTEVNLLNRIVRQWVLQGVRPSLKPAASGRLSVLQ